MVALLAEGVDRNPPLSNSVKLSRRSPSSRRAWIEIKKTKNPPALARSPSSRRAWIEIGTIEEFAFERGVALLAEGVDRNRSILAVSAGNTCRPPRGGRG